MKYFIILIFAASCAPKIEKQGRHIDASIYEHVAQFESIFNITVDYKITVESGLAVNQLGHCAVSGQNRRIVISEQFVNNNLNNPYAIEFVLFHELAHCSLNLGHNSEVLENGYPASIMNPSIFNVAQYETDRLYYIEQLKKAVNK